MHLCRLREDGEQGGGERALQSRGKGWDLEGQDAKEGGGTGWKRQPSCICTSSVIWG